MTPIPMDYHSHHRRCGHAVGEMDDYLRAAVACGLTQFGLSDHGPAWWLPEDHPQPGTQMAASEFPGYVREAHEMKARFANRIQVSVGVEVDWIDGREKELDALLGSQPLDYALGSVHYVGGVSIFRKNRWETDRPEDVFADYYRQVGDAARSGLFDILSHLTAVEAYAPDRESARRFYPAVADAVAEGGCLVEINTSGYRKMGGDEPFPNRAMLRLLIERGVGFTVASDCHRPEEVGFGFERVYSLLSELGVASEAQPFLVRRHPILSFHP